MVFTAVTILNTTGTIDAAVAGGVVQLVECFLTEKYIKSNPDKAHMVKKFSDNLEVQSKLLEEGLLIHRKLVPEKMRGLHEKMESKSANFSFLHIRILPKVSYGCKN